MLFMKIFISFILSTGILVRSSCLAEEDAGSLLSDLDCVYEIDQKLRDALPLFYNFSVMGGYYNMPSARMNQEGTMSSGASFPSPYQIYGVNVQPMDRIELSVNYLVYTGILEPGFGYEGFGDDAERMGNIKLGLLTPKEDLPFLPLISIGAQDFIGTKRFNAQYIVATKSWLNANLEVSLGWGNGRIKGFFGGGAWSPFRKQNHVFKDLSLQVEYDANDYKEHPGEHEKGRSVKSRLNAGLSCLLFSHLQLSLSSVRGEKIAASASLRYPLGTSEGLFPKIDDPKTYHSPIDTEPFGGLRSEKDFAHELAHALSDQGLDLYTVTLKKKELWVKIINNRYREHSVVKERIQEILAAITPSNIEEVIVVIEATALPCQSYRFRVQDLYLYRLGVIPSSEMEVLSPMKEAILPPGEYDATLLYRRTKPVWTFTARPRFVSFFGNASGKFKYNLSAVASPEGYLFDTLYYKAQASYSVVSTTSGMMGVDRLNPSHMFVVRSDSMKYYQTNSLHIEQAFLQRSWNFGKGFFGRLASGFFETAYAGFASECIYFPVQSPVAFGVECSTVWKRCYDGIGFFYKVRRYDGTKVEYLPFTGVQCLANLHYNFKPLSMDFTVTAGRFLAKDVGARLAVAKYFANGVRFSLWYSYTNANEQLNGHKYHDKGFAFLIPLDMFMKQSSRNYIGYAMSAWLRDQAAQADTGKPLYSILQEERFIP